MNIGKIFQSKLDWSQLSSYSYFKGKKFYSSKTVVI